MKSQFQLLRECLELETKREDQCTCIILTIQAAMSAINERERINFHSAFKK